MMPRFRPLIEKHGYFFALICIVFSTALFLLGRWYFAKEQWALLYLLIIGLVAGVSGVRPALLASVLAFFAWNYFFLPPFHTFVVADPKDWLSLFAFLIVGASVGLQTGRMREREAVALARERETALLNEFSAHLVSDTTAAGLADLLTREIQRATGASRVKLFLLDASGNLHELYKTADNQAFDPILEAAEWVRNESKAIGLPVQSSRISSIAGIYPATIVPKRINGLIGDNEVLIPLQTASSQEGVLVVGAKPDGQPYSIRNAELLVTIANQAAAFLERKHLQNVAVEANALQEADKLKSTLVSSVSHELKTPLASLTATVSNLLESDVEWDENRIKSELEAIQDDLRRLNSSIGALLDVSRLEASAWNPTKDLYEFGEIVGTAASKIPQKLRGRISYDLPDDLPMICVDFPQWARAIQNLLENALIYSPDDSSVRVGASYTLSEIRMWIEDEGPGIPEQDKSKVFEKFYRGKASGKVPSGTGLGLAVTREIVKFHGGRIWVEDIVPHGARVVISLPRENE